MRGRKKGRRNFFVNGQNEVTIFSPAISVFLFLCQPVVRGWGNMQTETYSLKKKKNLYHFFWLSYFWYTAVWLDWIGRNTLAIFLCVLHLKGKGGEMGSVSWVRYLSWYTYNSLGDLSSASSIVPICPFCSICTCPSVFCICTSLYIILPVTSSVYNSRCILIYPSRCRYVNIFVLYQLFSVNCLYLELLLNFLSFGALFYSFVWFMLSVICFCEFYISKNIALLAPMQLMFLLVLPTVVTTSPLSE